MLPIGHGGAVLGGAAGFEVDNYDPLLGSPSDATLLATATMGEGYDVWPDDVRDTVHAEPKLRADMVLRRVAGGGTVFSVGSIAWTGCLEADDDNPVARVTENVLRELASERPFPDGPSTESAPTTDVSGMSPVCVHAPTYARTGSRSPEPFRRSTDRSPCSGVHGEVSSSWLPTLTKQSASATWSMSPPFVSLTIAAVRRPSDSQARTVSMVSVWELPDGEGGADDAVGPERPGEPRREHRRTLLLERGVEVGEREDEPGESQAFAVAPEQGPHEDRVLVVGREVADRCPVVGAVRERTVEQFGPIQEGGYDPADLLPVQERVGDAGLRTRPARRRRSQAVRDLHPG